MATCVPHIESFFADLFNDIIPQMHLRPCFLDASMVEKKNDWYKQGVRTTDVSIDSTFHVGRCSSDGNLTRE